MGTAQSVRLDNDMQNWCLNAAHQLHVARAPITVRAIADRVDGSVRGPGEGADPAREREVEKAVARLEQMELLHGRSDGTYDLGAITLAMHQPDACAQVLTIAEELAAAGEAITGGSVQERWHSDGPFVALDVLFALWHQGYLDEGMGSDDEGRSRHEFRIAR